MAQTPYYGGNRPPPLFVAELDSQPGRPGDAPSHHRPDGAPVFEMSGEPVLAEQRQHHDMDQSSPSNQWPSPLQTPGMSKPTHQEEAKDKPSKDPSAVSQSAMANPWAYFGPEPSDSTSQQPQRPHIDDHRPSEPIYKPYSGNSEPNQPEVPYSTRPSGNFSYSDNQSDENVYYPAPLKLAHRPAKATTPPTFKPYAPPTSQDASDLQPKPLGRPDRTNSQSPVVSNPYRPYRPHSPQPPSGDSVHPPNARPATASPPQSGLLASPPAASQQQSLGTAPHHFQPIPPVQSADPPASDAIVSPKPSTSLPTSPGPQGQTLPSPQQQHGIPNAAPVQSVPSSVSTYLPSPMTPSAQPASVAAPSPATPALNAGVPFTQPQYTTHVAGPNYAQTSTPGAVSSSPAVSAAPSVNAGIPYSQIQYAAPVQAHNYGPSQAFMAPGTSAAAPSQLQSPVVSSPAYNPPQPTAQNSYNIPQPTYAQTQGQTTANPAPGSFNLPSPHQSAPYHQAAHVGLAMQQSHPQQTNTQPYGTPPPPASSQSPPPPPYAIQDTGMGAGTQTVVQNTHMMYQPSPVGAYPSQTQYPTQPTYATAMSPPLQGQSTHSLQPPALPPRPSSSQGFAPSGFGAGPTGYNPSNYPRPPQTYFSPPPALPPRPGLGKLSGGGGKIFGSSSADKWLRKTGQALESTLAPYLQGQSTSYRPGTNGPQGQQGQPVHQVPGAYPPQGNHFHAPHLAPQFRGNQESGPSPHGPGAS
ncbi:hypothetical protein KAF25_008190 [Fusarium avenaceum]|uniref:Uncharacterized protein n=1 Tax=Fusarium avenaceum TaxID=40199 RepID=A0A9P7KZF3_9HYPO|nr:hypothetical protein KAF25_008190 [Fusarium avenaceum]